jgi:hypothetical protein
MTDNVPFTIAGCTAQIKSEREAEQREYQHKLAKNMPVYMEAAYEIYKKSVTAALKRDIDCKCIDISLGNALVPSMESINDNASFENAIEYTKVVAGVIKNLTEALHTRIQTENPNMVIKLTLHRHNNAVLSWSVKL